MSAMAIPILPDQLEAWKAWGRELVTTRRADFVDFNDRMGLNVHRAWLFQSPSGPLAIVLHEGPGSDTFMSAIATSDHPFDQWFRESIGRFHGVDFSEPMAGPPPEEVIDWTSK